jgi:hypothetical protein
LVSNPVASVAHVITFRFLCFALTIQGD